MSWFNNVCDECKYKMYAEAFSYGECKICNSSVTTPHMPCDKLCDKCSEDHKRCKSCGRLISHVIRKIRIKKLFSFLKIW